jgi:sortase (surface protein transpeptidase)
MPSRRRRPSRLLLPILLAAVLAAEITGIALARSLDPTTALIVPVSAPSAGTLSGNAANGRTAVAAGAGVVDGSRDVDTTPSVTPPTRALAAKAPKASRAPSQPTANPRRTAKYRGTNRMWIPALGITKGIQSFPCSRSRAPDAGVYRWGCSGHNNVYLMGHAWSTFKPLHDAYVGGRLRKGMKVIYVDGSRRVHTYAVAWWKVVAPTTAASWAWASLRKPSMTLQTCVGSKSQYRLMVRLIEIR